MAAEIIRGPRDLPAGLKGAAVAVGAFDGVHRGHQAVIADAARAARAGAGARRAVPGRSAAGAGAAFDLIR